MNNAVATREQEARGLVASKMSQLKVLAEGDNAKASKFASVLVQLAQNNNLKQCSVESVINTGFQIVQAGLNPNPLFGQAYVVPYKQTAQLQIGVKGWVQLGYRAGWDFRAVPVYACDSFIYEFGGFEDKIDLIPNFKARNDTDAHWVYGNLQGVIVYARDSRNSLHTEFVTFNKLEKIRLKSPNQQAGALSNIWLEWAEEMYKAKALKYVITRLPVEDSIAEAIAAEDIVFKQESNQTPPAPQPRTVATLLEQQSAIDADTIETETEQEQIDLKSKFISALLAKRVKRSIALERANALTHDEIEAYLSDIGALDNLAEELK